MTIVSEHMIGDASQLDLAELASLIAEYGLVSRCYVAARERNDHAMVSHYLTQIAHMELRFLELGIPFKVEHSTIQLAHHWRQNNV